MDRRDEVRDNGPMSNAQVPDWTLADRLRKIRRHVGMSQAQFAALLGVRAPTYSAWEAGSITGLGIGVAAPASARPVDPLDEFVRPYDLGPDKSEWTCTYQVRYGEALCVYDPVPDRDMEPRARKNVDHWWNPWSWFLD